MEVLWDEEKRMKTPVVLNWEGCQYSKCGRTDRGVSAFGQVIGIRVRSNRPLKSIREKMEQSSVKGDGSTNGLDVGEDGLDDLPGLASEDEEEFGSDNADAAFDDIEDELPYLSILNSILPRDIRALAWCPNPPEDFNARFSCGQRRYKYFFTNPAFLPTPGKVGLKDQDNKDSMFRQGYLDIEAMREACGHFIGLHDFRNFCRVDESKQMPGCERRILHASIDEVAHDVPRFLAQIPECAAVHGMPSSEFEPRSNGLKVYCFTVHGTAFLWHQIRCMVAILFLIGQRFEKPWLVKELLDIESNPCRPIYDMASDAPLVLWDCLFPNKDGESLEDSLDWVYAGDARGMEALKTKSDGKFGLGGTVDEVWKVWRKRKMDEILACSLLDLVAGQGDGTSLQRGGVRLVDDRPQSQKVYDGGNSARYAGEYISVMKRPRMDTLEAQNARWREGRGARRAVQKENEASED